MQLKPNNESSNHSYCYSYQSHPEPFLEDLTWVLITIEVIKWVVTKLVRCETVLSIWSFFQRSIIYLIILEVECYNLFIKIMTQQTLQFKFVRLSVCTVAWVGLLSVNLEFQGHTHLLFSEHLHLALSNLNFNSYPLHCISVSLKWLSSGFMC